MRRKLFRAGVVWRLLIALILALCLVPSGYSPAAALSADDYFEITYETVEFSKTEIHGDEIFNATITVTATRNNNDFPLNLSPSEALITGRIIAEHQATGTKVTLNSSYTVTISSFPPKGETAQESEIVSLQFPEESQSGTYTVVGELINAEVTVLGIAIPATEYLPSSQIMGSVTYTAPDGGGGGGFGPAPALPSTGEEIMTNLFGTGANSSISSSGEILETIEATSEDGALTLTIAEGTIALDKNANPLISLEAEVDTSPPPPPEDTSIIGLAYDFGPDGATFDPPIALTRSYNSNDIPEGVAEEDLVLAWYDETADKWVELEDYVVDTENNIITASVTHFTTFAIIGAVIPIEPALAPAPAAFTPISLSISPVEANIGDEVTISLFVVNTGGESGSYEVTLKINGAVATTKKVKVSAGFSKEVTFKISEAVAGIYSVNIDGLSGSFVVKPTAISEPEPASTLTPPATHTPPPAKPINWTVAYGVVAALVAMGLLLFFLARRSHTKSSS